MLDQDTWRFINTFAPWFSAFGTFAAVCVSLYLSRSGVRQRLKVRIDERLLIQQGVDSKEAPRFLFVNAVNLGTPDVIITMVSWRVGMFRPSTAMQIADDNPYSKKLPVTLKFGEEATLLYRLDPDPTLDWVKQFCESLIVGRPWWKRRPIWVVLHASTGRDFAAKVSGKLLKTIRARAKQLEGKT